MLRPRRLLLKIALVGLTGFTACATPHAPAPLVTGEKDVQVMVSDLFHLYWSTSTGEVRRVSLDGGKVEVVATGKAGPQLLTLDDDNVYFVGGDSVLRRVPKNGGEQTTVITAVGDGGVQGIAVDAESIYFSQGKEVKRLPKMATESDEPSTLSGEFEHPSAIYVRSGLVVQDGSSFKQLGSGGAVTLVDAPSQIGSSSYREARVAFVDSGSMTAPAGVRVADVDLGIARTVGSVEPGTSLQVSVAIDHDNVYYAKPDGTVHWAAIAAVSSGAADGGAGGGSSSSSDVFVSGPAGTVKLAVDDTGIYVANATDGTIVAAQKPSASGYEQKPCDSSNYVCE